MVYTRIAVFLRLMIIMSCVSSQEPVSGQEKLAIPGVCPLCKRVLNEIAGKIPENEELTPDVVGTAIDVRSQRGSLIYRPGQGALRRPDVLGSGTKLITYSNSDSRKKDQILIPLRLFIQSW